MTPEELNAVGDSELSLEDMMRLAIHEGHLSYREGNNGYGCVIAMDGRVIAASHDKSLLDPLSHAVSNTITEACRAIGSNSLQGATVVSTHELCPMCAALAVQVGVTEIAYGYLNKQILYTGRLLVSLTCREIISKASTKIKLHEGVLSDECTILYRKDVKEEIARLRGAGGDDDKLRQLGEASKERRRKWFYENEHRFVRYPDDPLFGAYQYLLDRLNITERMAPIVEKTSHRLVYHLSHFCPTLEACKILGLDTHHVCGVVFDESTDQLIKLYDSSLKFYRNYDQLRPEYSYCVEVIELEQ